MTSAIMLASPPSDVAAPRAWTVCKRQLVILPAPIRSRLTVNTAEAAIEAAHRGRRDRARVMSYKMEARAAFGSYIVVDAWRLLSEHHGPCILSHAERKASCPSSFALFSIGRRHASRPSLANGLVDIAAVCLGT